MQHTVAWPMISHLLKARCRAHGEGVVDVDEAEEGQQRLHEQGEFNETTKGSEKGNCN